MLTPGFDGGHHARGTGGGAPPPKLSAVVVKLGGANALRLCVWQLFAALAPAAVDRASLFIDRKNKRFAMATFCGKTTSARPHAYEYI